MRSFYPLPGAATLISCWKRFSLTLPQRKTISIETGVQNAQIAVAIINLAGYDQVRTGQMVLFPVIYLLFQVNTSVVNIYCVRLVPLLYLAIVTGGGMSL